LKSPSIIILIPYFGQWPEWIDFFIESCKFNPDIDWLFYTDCGLPNNKANNVRFIELSFEAYKKQVSQQLGIKFDPPTPYKLCDLKPAYGYLHQDDIATYDFYGFGDIDIIFGQIRHFITDEMLARFNVISTQPRRLSGHFCLLRNTEAYRTAFQKIPHWQSLLETNHHLGIDESKFSKLFLRHKNHPRWLQKLWSLTSAYQRHVLFEEQYSTILSPIKWLDGRDDHPKNWFWQNGHLTNDRDNREFMYLHFMNWKSNTWLPKPQRFEPSAWMELDKLVHVDLQQAQQHGFKISPAGFSAI